MAPQRFLITAGPTREPIDAVRFIGNRSSGKMGAALARAAVAAGHEVTLLLGAGAGEVKLEGVRVERFESTADLEKLLLSHWPGHDVLLMAAAVADYRPAAVQAGKLPRGEAMTLRLEPTPDLVAKMAAAKKPGQRVIAFALEEPGRLEERAAEKLRRKGVDAIVANPLETMDAETITTLYLTAGGERVSPGVMSKSDFAKWLIRLLE